MPQKFPQIGLLAIFEIAGYTSNARKYISLTRDIDRATQKTARSVSGAGSKIGTGFARNIEELINQSRLLENAFNSGGLSAASFNFLNDSLNNLGQGIGLNVDKFDKLIESGASVGEAFQQAQGPIEDLSGTVNILGRSFTTSAVAISGATAALGASVALVRKSISEYNDLAEATRRLRAQTGLLSQEASGWVLATQASGVSAAAAERALTSFLGKVSALSREQAAGEESTSAFSEAIETLDIDIKNIDGTLKTTAQLLGEVEAAFRDLGPGALSAETATALFGFSGRALLPIMQSTKLSLSELMQIAKDYGGTLNALSQTEYEDFKRSQFELLVALQGVYNFIAKQWTPVLTEVQRIIASATSIWRTFIQIITGTEAPARTLAQALNALADTLEVVNKLLQIGAKWAQVYRDALNPGAAAARALAQEEEKLAQARGIASQAAKDAADREKKLREEREKTLEQLDELKSKLIQKLDDIDQDARQKWEDILVNRMRDAADRALQNVFKLEDLRQALNAKMDAIDRDFARRWDDILVKRQREALERGIALAQRFEDLTRATEQRRQDAIRSFQDREVKQHRDLQRRIAEVERDGRDKREKLERDHRERLFKIQQDYLDTVQEAARSNDAVAVARAMRERARAVRDEERRFGNEQRDLGDSLRKKREDIDRDRREREQDQRNELARTLQRIEENAGRQREEILRQNRRAREARQRAEALELEDFNKAKAEQEQAALDAYQRGRDELDKANKRADILRKIQYERQERDFVLSWQRRIREARQWYQQERNDLAAHLNITGQQLERAYTVWMQTAALAAGQVARTVSATMAAALAGPGGAPTTKSRQAAGSGPTSKRGSRYISMAEGGVIQANSPTNVVMGDAGPEMGIFLPGGSSSMNVNHSFGRMGVDIEGLPGGMNTPQVTALFYQLMAQVAKQIQVPRS